MQDLEKTKMTQSQDQAIDTQTALPAWVPPKITEYKEEDLLKRATVFGCSLQAGNP